MAFPYFFMAIVELPGRIAILRSGDDGSGERVFAGPL